MLKPVGRNNVADQSKATKGLNRLLFQGHRETIRHGVQLILILGAAYGSLLASKMLFGGHKIHHVCLPAEADLINAEGFRSPACPVKGRTGPVVLDSTKLPGKVTAGPATGVNPRDYDLIGLAMQEPQYRSPGVRELLDAVAKSRVPCNVDHEHAAAALHFGLSSLNYAALENPPTQTRGCGTASTWLSAGPLCGPDPQAIRPHLDEKVNVLVVTLPTNFKVAKFDNEKGTAILRQQE